MLVAAARCGLPGVRSPTTPVPASGPSHVVDAAAFDRTTGLLAAAIREGAVAADSAIEDATVRAWRAALVGAVRAEALLVRVAAVLDGGEIRWRLTKGPAVAHLDYGDDPSLRTFGDVDVMIHVEDWSRGLEVLRDLGFDRPAPELRPGFDARFGKGATLVDDTGMEVDLHLRFAIGRFGVRARTAELFDRSARLRLGGRTIPALEGPDRLLHACHHLALGGFSGLRAARDVAQQLLVSGVDWERTVETAQRWRVDAVVARAILDSWARLELEVVHPAEVWARAHPIRRADRRALDVFAGDRPFRDQALTALPALPIHRVPAYLLALAAPRTVTTSASHRT